MTHILPPHPELNIAQSSLQSALQMDPSAPQPPPPPDQQSPQPSSAGSRKRKKTDSAPGEPSTPAEPRRLRRSHEACARCRSKKIKASPVGRHRRQLPVLSLILCIASSSTVRLKASKMYCLCYGWHSLPPGGQTQADPHPSRIHRAHRAPAPSVRCSFETSYSWFRHGQPRRDPHTRGHRNRER